MMNVKIKFYNGVKYNLENEKIAEVEYNNIRGYEVVAGDRATEIGLETDENSRDEYNEYLIITLEDGETATVMLICLETNSRNAGHTSVIQGRQPCI